MTLTDITFMTISICRPSYYYNHDQEEDDHRYAGDHRYAADLHSIVFT